MIPSVIYHFRIVWASANTKKLLGNFPERNIFLLFGQ